MNSKYSYYVKISLPFLKSLNEIDFEKMKKIYKNLKIISNKFPSIGTIETTNINGYGVDDCNGNIFKEIIQFTEQFPELTFRVFYSYFDLKCLIMCDIQKKNIINIKHFEDEKIIKEEFTIYTNYSNIKIDNDITDFINGNKNYEKILERRYSQKTLKELNQHFIIG